MDELTERQADCLARLIEYATKDSWQKTAAGMISDGWSAEEIVDSTTALCDIAGIESMLSLDDF